MYNYGLQAFEDMRSRNSLTKVLTKENLVRQLLDLAIVQQSELLALMQLHLSLNLKFQVQDKTITELKRMVEAMSTPITDLRLIMSTPRKNKLDSIEVSNEINRFKRK